MTKSIDEKYSAILMFGAPGSGKGTQAQLLANDKKYFHFSTGNMFRALRKTPELASSELGKRILTLIDGGNYVPDQETVDLFRSNLQDLKNKGILTLETILLLDGIPRTIPQVSLINDFINVRKIIYLDCDNDQEMIERIIKRAVIEGRPDDQDPETIRKRLQIYRNTVLPMIAKYPKEKIITINAIDTIDNIHSKIVQSLA